MKLISLEGDSWTKRTARIGFPILIEYAQARREITYGEWDTEIVRRGLGKHVIYTQYGKPAGSIGDACEEYAEKFDISVPLINLMVVNQKTRVPGSGADYYIEQFCAEFLSRKINPARLTLREKQAIIDRAKQEIFDFPGWTDVLDGFGLKQVKSTRSLTRSQKKRRHPNSRGWHTGPESEAHKELKPHG